MRLLTLKLLSSQTFSDFFRSLLGHRNPLHLARRLCRGRWRAAILRNVLPKSRRQMALRKQKPVVTCVLDQPSIGLHQALLQVGQRPVCRRRAGNARCDNARCAVDIE